MKKLKNRIAIFFRGRKENIEYARMVDEMYNLPGSYYNFHTKISPRIPYPLAILSIKIFGNVVWNWGGIKRCFMEYKDSKWQ